MILSCKVIIFRCKSKIILSQFIVFNKKMIIFVTMNNIYYRDIIELLLPFGQEGLKLSSIVRHIYNQHADLFNKNIRYEEIHKTVGLFLWKQSQKRESPFRHNSFGVYSIKPDIAVQLDLFWDMPEETIADETKESTTGNTRICQLELFKQFE